MCSTMVPGAYFLSGRGPLGLALGTRPLPLATKRCLPSRVTRTEVGYQPTGMKPSERLLPRRETSKTATLLLQALATNNLSSSGDGARLFGVEPLNPSGCNAAQIVSRALPWSVSKTATVLRFAFAA